MRHFLPDMVAPEVGEEKAEVIGADRAGIPVRAEETCEVSDAADGMGD